MNKRGGIRSSVAVGAAFVIVVAAGIFTTTITIASYVSSLPP